MLDAAPLGAAWIEDLASKVGSADGPEGAASAVDAWAEQLAADDRFAALLYQTAFQTYLAGQLMVRGIELEEESAESLPGTIALTARSRGSAARSWEDSFLALPFEQALEFFRSKRLLSEAEFDSLSDRYKEGGFIARRLASERLQEVARQSIGALLAQDLTLADVVRTIRTAEAPEVRALGITPASPSYLETVIRTNVASAYGYGRQQAMDDPDVLALRPYRQQWTAGDVRVRPGHAALHGLVFDAHGELASRYAPPLYYNCRCSQTTLSERQFRARGLSVTTSRVAKMEAERFWIGPTAPIEPLLEGVTAEPTRPLTTHRRAFEGLSADEANDVATGQRPPATGGSTWEPVVIDDARLFRGGGITIHDGNHRITAAAEAGAIEILARIRVYDARGDIQREELRIVPLDGVEIRKRQRAVGT